jgi:hypothetical protein
MDAAWADIAIPPNLGAGFLIPAAAFSLEAGQQFDVLAALRFVVEVVQLGDGEGGKVDGGDGLSFQGFLRCYGPERESDALALLLLGLLHARRMDGKLAVSHIGRSRHLGTDTIFAADTALGILGDKFLIRHLVRSFALLPLTRSMYASAAHLSTAIASLPHIF